MNQYKKSTKFETEFDTSSDELVCIGGAPALKNVDVFTLDTATSSDDEKMLTWEKGFDFSILEKDGNYGNFAMKRELRPLSVEVSDVSDISDDEVVEVRQPVKETTPIKGQGPKVMRWCVTYNNPIIEGAELAKKLEENENVKGFIFQLEKGANGTPHFQMYIEFKKQCYFTAVQKIVDNKTIHCEKANAQKAQNIKYCSKEDGRLEGPWKYGSCLNNVGPGGRNDLNDLGQKVLASGQITEELINENSGSFIKYGHHIKKLLNDVNDLRNRKKNRDFWLEQVRREDAGEDVLGQQQRECVLYFGPTGCRKTTMATARCYREETAAVGPEKVDEILGPYIKNGNNKWWCGYASQKWVVIDEWHGDMATITNFNGMTNIGGAKVEYKGGNIDLVAEKLFFTTNSHPLDIFKVKKGCGLFKAVMRRFAEVNWWNDSYELTTLKNPDQFTAGSVEKALAMEKWMHFWNGQQREIVEGDEVVAGEESYYTW